MPEPVARSATFKGERDMRAIGSVREVCEPMWTSSDWSVPGAPTSLRPAAGSIRRGDRSLGATWVRTCARAKVLALRARRQLHAFSWRPLCYVAGFSSVPPRFPPPHARFRYLLKRDRDLVDDLHTVHTSSCRGDPRSARRMSACLLPPSHTPAHSTPACTARWVCSLACRSHAHRASSTSCPGGLRLLLADPATVVSH